MYKLIAMVERHTPSATAKPAISAKLGRPRTAELAELAEYPLAARKARFLAPRADAVHRYDRRPEQVMHVLKNLHHGQTETLKFGGFNEGIARVRLRDWRLACSQACPISEIEFYRVLRALEAEGAVIREHGHVRPAV